MNEMELKYGCNPNLHVFTCKTYENFLSHSKTENRATSIFSTG